MDEHLARLQDALDAAGVAMPDDPRAMELEDLDDIADPVQRGRAKSALQRFKHAAEEHGWEPVAAAEPAAAVEAEPEPAPPAAEAITEAPAPEPTAVPEPAPAPEPVAAAPMPEALAEPYAAVEAAFNEAGVPVPDDPISFELDELDQQIDDRRLRGKAKSALVKFRRSAEAEGWSPSQPAQTRMAVTPEPAAEAPESAPTPTAQPEAAPAAEAEPEVVPQPQSTVEAEPMSAELQTAFEVVKDAFSTAGVDVPADPVNFELADLDEAVPDRMVRGRMKSALVKFQKAAKAEGWTPAPAALPSTAPKPGIPDEKARAQAAADVLAGDHDADRVPPVPAGSPNDLFLLTTTGWEKLGTATRQPTHTDELVNQTDDKGGVRRITSILILDGKFKVPQDIYNTWVWLAHEHTIYRAYYISHVGDVRRGTLTASLKVEATYDFDAFRRLFVRLGRHDRPTADDMRRARFGGLYDTFREMFKPGLERVR